VPATPGPALPALPIHGPQPAAPAASVHQAEQAKVCAALDGKNAALKERIGTLEGKVKLLQGALRAAPPAKAAPIASLPPVAAAAAATPPASVPAAPKSIHAIKPLVPRRLKVPAPAPALAPAPAPAHEAGLPWGWIAGGVALLLALGGAAAAVVRRKRSKLASKAELPQQPRLAERLRHTFPNRAKPARAGAAHNTSTQV
jgi:pilus assembly protein FimV